MSGSVTARRSEGERRAREPDERPRDELAEGAQPGDRTAFAEARRDHEVAVRALRLLAQRRDGSRRMLEIRIHDAHPGGASGRDSRDHGTAEAAVPLAGRAVDDRDLEACGGAPLGHDRGRIVVRIVDDDELGVDARAAPRRGSR